VPVVLVVLIAAQPAVSRIAEQNTTSGPGQQTAVRAGQVRRSRASLRIEKYLDIEIL
jgi:hypothetical protein